MPSGGGPGADDLFDPFDVLDVLDVREQPDQDDESDTLGEAAFAFATWLEEWVDDCIERGVDHLAEYVIPARPLRPLRPERPAS